MKYSTILLASIALLVVSCNRFGNTIEDPRIEYRVWKNGQWTTDWMRAYVDYYENAVLEYCGEKVKDVFQQWALVYIDNDDIPEMVLFCPGEAYGNMVLSYYDGKVSEWASWRCNLKFIPRSGLLHNRDGSMGEYWDKVIRLKNGQFTEIYNHTDMLLHGHDAQARPVEVVHERHRLLGALDVRLFAV
jgi:hypothetical protein